MRLLTMMLCFLGPMYALAECARGVSIPDPEHLNKSKPGRMKRNALQTIQSLEGKLQIQIIRIPIHPGDRVHQEGFLNSPQSYFQKNLIPILNWAKERKIQLVLDAHFVDDFLNREGDALRFWETLIPLLPAGGNFIFQIFNEATTPHDWDLYKNRIIYPIIKIIRPKFPQNTILIGTPRWNTLYEEVIKSPVEGPNIAYSFHIYPNEWAQKNWDTRYAPMAQKYPFILSEWGFTHQQEKNQKLQGTVETYAIPLLEKVNQFSHCLGTVAWIYDNLWMPPMLNDSGELSSEQNSFGHFVKGIWGK